MNELITTKKLDLKTIDLHYHQTIRDFMSWKKPEDYTDKVDFIKRISAKINDYLTELSKQGLKAKTLNFKKCALKRIIIHELGGSACPPAIKGLVDQIYNNTVKRYKTTNTLRAEKFLKRYEVESLIKNCTRRMSLIIKFLFSTGCRVSELTGLKINDVTDHGDYFSCRIMGKGSKERFLNAPISLIIAIQETFKGNLYLFTTQGGKPYLRGNIGKELKRQARRILNKNVTPHMLRHSLASYQINVRNMNLSKVKELLGHSDIKTTMIYAHGRSPDFNEMFDGDGEML